MKGTAVQDGRTYDASLLIGGAKRNSARRLTVYNPAHPCQIVGTVGLATATDIDDAVSAACAAQPAWAAQTFVDRAEALARICDRLGEDIDRRAKLYVRENGKTLAEATRELADVPSRARLTLSLAAGLDHQKELSAPDGRTMVGYVPFGVVVSIVPWNAPVSLACMQIIPALLAGNSVVLKAPESCPLTLIQTAEMIAEGLPPGLLNIVTGTVADIGDALTMHPNVGKVGFTGSIPSARKILANAAQSITSVTTELGGNDPAIFLEDADLGDEAMTRVATIVFRMTGQVCMAIKRIYVPESIHDRFVDALGRAVDRIIVGDGLEPAVTMGPLHSRTALERATEIIADARRGGAKIVKYGKIDRPETFDGGFFMQPMIVTDVDNEARLVVEEQFCPAIPVVRYRDIEEALERANATMFGLGGSVWSANVEKAVPLARRIQAGTVFVNTHGTNSINRQAPYGGLKQSGIGRRAGLEGVQEYMQLQTLTTYEQG